jgi:hypothetical protein
MGEPSFAALSSEASSLLNIAGDTLKLVAGDQFHSMSLCLHRRDDGSAFYTVYPHGGGMSSQGIGETPADAFEDAIKRLAPTPKQEAA